MRRRQFVKAALAFPAIIALEACSAQKPVSVRLDRVFFSAEEYRFVTAAVDRLIPGDAGDPGAVEADVPLFIDLQLAGPYGRADRWYMDGPWATGVEQQGYQLRQTPAQLYRMGIAGINEYCRRQFGGKAFADLPGQQRDRVLQAMDEGKIGLADFPAQAFFKVLWQNTQEGFLSDPMYGGNRDFAGWRLIGFPGPRYNYVQEITQYGKSYPWPPVGILGRDGARMRTVI